MKRISTKLVQISASSHERIKQEAYRLGIPIHSAAELAIREGIRVLEGAKRVVLEVKTFQEADGAE